MSLVTDLYPVADELRRMAGELGARYYTVETRLRSWNGKEAGEGKFTDKDTTIEPTPRVKEYSADYQVAPGGGIEIGDLLLSGVSKAKYVRKDLDGGDLHKKLEFYWIINDRLYRVIGVTEDLIDWKVMLRPTAHKKDDREA